MNNIESIKIQIKDNLGDCDIFIHDESQSHNGHFIQTSQTIPSHLQIKVVSDIFNNMPLIERHRKINDIMKNYFNEGLHALKIIAKTNKEEQNDSSK